MEHSRPPHRRRGRRDPRDPRDPLDPGDPREPVDRDDPGAPYELAGFRFSGGSIIAGLAVAVALQVLFSLLGMAIGLSWWDPNSAQALGIASGVWTIVSWMAALFLGALVASRLAGVLTPGDGALHGFVIWAGATVIAAFFILSGVSFLAGTAFNFLGQTVAGATSAAVSGATDVAIAAGGQADEIDFGSLQRDVEDALREAGIEPDTLEVAPGATQDPDRVPTDSVAGQVVQTIEDAAGEIDRQDIANIIASNSDLSQEEAENLAERVEQLASGARQQVSETYDTVVTQARRAAPQAAEDLGAAAWWTLLTLVLSGAAATAGGFVTARS